MLSFYIMRRWELGKSPADGHLPLPRRNRKETLVCGERRLGRANYAHSPWCHGCDKGCLHNDPRSMPDLPEPGLRSRPEQRKERRYVMSGVSGSLETKLCMSRAAGPSLRHGCTELDGVHLSACPSFQQSHICNSERLLMNLSTMIQREPSRDANA